MLEFKFTQKAYIYNIDTRVYNYYIPKLIEGSAKHEKAQSEASYNILDVLDNKHTYIIAPDYDGLRMKVMSYIDSLEESKKLSKRDADFQRYRCQTITIYDIQKIN